MLGCRTNFLFFAVSLPDFAGNENSAGLPANRQRRK
jgi:hypothetical protein